MFDYRDALTPWIGMSSNPRTLTNTVMLELDILTSALTHACHATPQPKSLTQPDIRIKLGEHVKVFKSGDAIQRGQICFRAVNKSCQALLWKMDKGTFEAITFLPGSPVLP